MVKRNLSPKLRKPKDPKDTRKSVMRPVSGVKSPLSDFDKHWYDLDEDKIAGAVQQLVIQIDLNNQDLTREWERYARMYGNYDNLALTGTGSADGNSYDGSTNIPSYNIIQSSVDTLTSKICPDNPKPYFITSNADYFTKLKAEKQTQFVQGVFQGANLYEKANNQVFRDAAVYGIGGLHFHYDEDKQKICAEWIFVDEIKIDRVDAFKKHPRSIHLCKLAQKETLLEKFPEQEDVIEDMAGQHPEYFRSKETVIEFMVTIESWHLKNGKKPGRHVISLQDKVLLDEEYDEDYFPCVFFNYYDKGTGIFGRGVADTLFNHQIEINKLLLMIQQCQELQAAPLIFVPNEAQIASDVLLNNNIARMVPYRGNQVPTFMAPQAVDPAVYEHLKWWIESSYGEVGISMTSAAGTKQPGVDSAIAMRTMVDIESSRFVQVSKNWEKFFVNCAETVIKIGKRVYETNKNFSVTYMDKKSKILKEIPWKSIDPDEDMFVIQCDTISGFTNSAAGRIQTVTEFISNGWFSRERGLELLGMDPDLDGEIQLQTSSLRLCEKRLSQMVEEGIYNHPEKYMDLQLALNVSERMYNQLVLDECPEERLQLVRQWIDELITKTTGQDPAVMQLQQIFAPPAPPTMAPQAGPNPAGVQPQQGPQPPTQ